jgi:hypothetical protein
MTPSDCAIAVKPNRSVSYHSVKAPGEERTFHLVLADLASGTAMRADLDRAAVAHLARAMLASVGVLDHLDD